MNKVKNIKDACFVCGEKITAGNSELNMRVYLPVCWKCKGSPEEKKAVEEHLDSLADGFVCGCI